MVVTRILNLYFKYRYKYKKIQTMALKKIRFEKYKPVLCDCCVNANSWVTNTDMHSEANIYDKCSILEGRGCVSTGVGKDDSVAISTVTNEYLIPQ